MTKVTESEERLQLSEKQNVAIKEMLQGKTDQQVADIAGVSRKTISKWKNDNPYFIAEWNCKRKEIWESFMGGYRELADDCLRAIKKAINEDDVKTAIWFLEKSGVTDVVAKNIDLEKPRGFTAPEDIIESRAQKLAIEEVSDPFDFDSLLPDNSVQLEKLMEDFSRKIEEDAKRLQKEALKDAA